MCWVISYKTKYPAFVHDFLILWRRCWKHYKCIGKETDFIPGIFYDMMGMGVGGEFRWGFGEFGDKVLKWNSWQMSSVDTLPLGMSNPDLSKSFIKHLHAHPPTHTECVPLGSPASTNDRILTGFFWWFCQILKLIRICSFECVFGEDLYWSQCNNLQNGINNHTCKLCRPVRIYPAAPSRCRNVVCVWIYNVKGKSGYSVGGWAPFIPMKAAQGRLKPKMLDIPNSALWGLLQAV